jgi:hypothetical protein
MQIAKTQAEATLKDASDLANMLLFLPETGCLLVYHVPVGLAQDTFVTILVNSSAGGGIPAW